VRRQHGLAIAAGLPVAQQKSELISILDRAAALNLNAVVLQVRPSADALYASQKSRGRRS
jgi:uncharacterized lipoprotein YddW (UPF0748 family)